MKAIAWFVPFILIMLIVSILSAFFGFTKKIIVEKRFLEEKILSTGNRLEVTGIMIQQAGDLSTLQALYDVGHFNIVFESDMEFNELENLPYWSEKEEEYIKNSVLKLAEIYFSNYNKSFYKYFIDPEYSKERYKYWFVEWEKNMKIEKFEYDEISINFGYFNLTYDDSQIRITKKYPIISHLKTHFNKTLDKSFDVINMIKNKKDINEIKKILSNENISLILEDKGEYVYVFIFENSKRKVYNINSQRQEYNNLGIKFLVEKTPCLCLLNDCLTMCSWSEIGFFECPTSSCEKQKNLGKKIFELENIKKCGDVYILKEYACKNFIYN
ncbi:MAG: hypothetical protein QXJ06_00440 [Candidatus Aenigmatarchaeota archaeon]